MGEFRGEGKPGAPFLVRTMESADLARVLDLFMQDQANRQGNTIGSPALNEEIQRLDLRNRLEKDDIIALVFMLPVGNRPEIYGFSITELRTDQKPLVVILVYNQADEVVNKNPPKALLDQTRYLALLKTGERFTDFDITADIETLPALVTQALKGTTK